MQDTVEYRGFDGVDNRRSNFDLPEGALRDGVNVDILAAKGRVRSRRGIVQTLADPGAHSGYSSGPHAIWATPSALKVATTPGGAATTVLEHPLLAKPISYCTVNGVTYWTNEDLNGTVTAAGLYEPWGITGPTEAPDVMAIAGDRIVQVTCAFVDATGKLSGAPLGTAVECSDDPVLLVTGIPQSSDSRVVATRLFVTGLDGTEFFACADVPAGVLTTTLAYPFENGGKLTTQFLEPMPPGQLIDYQDGALYVAKGPLLLHTKALRYDLYDPSATYLMEPERITLLKAVTDGIYVSSNATYFISKPATAQRVRTPIHPHRAIEGAACGLPDSEDVMWLSEGGFMRGAPGGAVKSLTEDRLAVNAWSSACMGHIQYKGHKAVVAIARQEVDVNPLVSDDYSNAEAERLAAVE